MESKTNSKKITEIFFLKPHATKGRAIFITVAWFITTCYVIFVVTDGFTQSVFRKGYEGLCFLTVLNLFLMINSWRRYFKQRLA